MATYTLQEVALCSLGAIRAASIGLSVGQRIRCGLLAIAWLSVGIGSIRFRSIHISMARANISLQCISMSKLAGILLTGICIEFSTCGKYNVSTCMSPAV
jgi:hypothetical protein